MDSTFDRDEMSMLVKYKVMTVTSCPCKVRVVAKRTKTCGSFRDLKLTNDIKTTTTLYTIQTEVINYILVSSPITLGGGGGGINIISHNAQVKQRTKN